MRWLIIFGILPVGYGQLLGGLPIESLLYLQLPWLLNQIDEITVNFNDENECKRDMKFVYEGVLQQEMWAYKMLDSNSKIPSGILMGNIVDFGHFDECISVKHKEKDFEIKGKHCFLGLTVPFTLMQPQYKNNISRQVRLDLPNLDDVAGLYLSLCIPDTCAPSQVIEYLNLQIFNSNDDFCQIDEPYQVDGGDLGAIILLAIILIFMLGSSAYDIYLRQIRSAPSHPALVAFSLVTNTEKLLKITHTADQLSCINGLKVISIFWITAAHRYSTYLNYPAMNSLEFADWPKELYSQYIQAAPFAVDTFFFFSGTMISYGFFKVPSTKRPKNVVFVPVYYLHRYLRIAPAAGALFLFSVTIFRYFGTGPAWPIITSITRESCLKWWWSYFFYVQNYANHDDICLIQTWYLSADMQLFLISPLILLPMAYILIRKNKLFVYGLCAVLIAIFALIQITVQFFIESDNMYMTHERLSVWMIGFTVGILLEETKRKQWKVQINSVLNLLIWILVLTLMISVALVMHDVTFNPVKIKTDLFYTLSRLVWGFGLAWITYACTFGYGGFINTILSLPVFQIFSRLTYSMYLVQFIPIVLSSAQARMPRYVTEFYVIYAWCGDIIFITLLAFFWVLAFESPVIAMEKHIFGNRRSKSEIKQDPVHDITTDNAGIIPISLNGEERKCFEEGKC